LVVCFFERNPKSEFNFLVLAKPYGNSFPSLGAPLKINRILTVF
jgi:hypothetical protein